MPYSRQIDVATQKRLAVAQRYCLLVAAAFSLVTLLLWLLTNVHPIPRGAWTLMKANSALLVLGSVASLTLSSPKATPRMLRASRVLAALVMVLASAVLLEYITHRSLGIDTLLAADVGTRPGRSSPQTAVAFLLLGGVMLGMRVRKHVAAICIDLLAFLFCGVVLVMLSGYVFGAMDLFGLSSGTRSAPETMGCLMVLAFVAFGRRAEAGVFSAFLGAEIGGKIARILCPIALVLPFVLEVARGAVLGHHWASPRYVSALLSSLAAMLILALVLLITDKINQLESSIREMAIRDELTHVYNRRGFHLLAENSLLMAQRAGAPFTVLFVDLDNLKSINDTMGHDKGSEFLSEVGQLLLRTFRTTDVIGRIGGDEFVVAGQSNDGEMEAALTRLEQAALALNSIPGRAYPFQFSYGVVTTDANETVTLDELVGSADTAMYQIKQRKKAARTRGSLVAGNGTTGL